MPDWIELVCILDDLDVRAFLELEPEKLTTSEKTFREDLRTLVDQIDVFSETTSDKATSTEVLSDLRWARIQELAKRISQE
jgi:hypothetical protein